MKKVLPRHFGCATEFTLAVLGGKWKTIILCYLKQRPLRYRELRRLLPKLSDKVLTERLRELEEADLVSRSVLSKLNGTSGYKLTRRGESLGELLNLLYEWGEKQAGPFGVTCGRPMAELNSDGAGPAR